MPACLNARAGPRKNERHSQMKTVLKEPILLDVHFPADTDADFVRSIAEDVEEEMVGYGLGLVIAADNDSPTIIERDDYIGFTVEVKGSARELIEAFGKITWKLHQKGTLEAATIIKIHNFVSVD